MRSISSRQNPIVRTFRDLAAETRAGGPRVLLDGLHLVQDARAAGVSLPAVAVLQALLDDEASPVGALARAIERDGADAIAVTPAVMSALSPVQTPSGIVAIAERQPIAPDDIYGHPQALILVAVHVQDPGNVGGLVRAAEALGATGVIACGASANPFSWKALRGSMGSALRLPVLHEPDVRIVLARLRDSGVTRIATTTRSGRPPSQVEWSGRIAILVGGEGAGLEETLLANCDERVTIPMRPPVESLNVAVAGALLLDEARRHRS